MKQLVSQVLHEYFKKMREPKLEELTVDEKLMQEKASCFVTFYLNGEVCGSAGNVKEIHPNLAQELISNTISALTSDKRFSPLTLEQAEKIQFRIDLINDRKIISTKELKALDPVTHGCIAIKRDYEKLAVVLPNMSPKLLTGDDFIPVLLNKLEEKKLEDNGYILYQITTTVETNY